MTPKEAMDSLKWLTAEQKARFLAEVISYTPGSLLKWALRKAKGESVAELSAFTAEFAGRCDKHGTWFGGDGGECLECVREERTALKSENEKLRGVVREDRDDDIVDWLRQQEEDGCREAADEIERLRKRNELLTDHYECKMSGSERASRLEADVERLRAALESAFLGMQYLGDVLNGMDAVSPEDQAITAPLFAAVDEALGDERTKALMEKLLAMHQIATAGGSHE